MDNTAAQEIVKKPHTFDPVSGAYKELTKEPDPFYPKCKYAAPQGGTEPYRAVVVISPEEEAALGADWYDHHNLIPKALPTGRDVASAAWVQASQEAYQRTIIAQAPPKRRGRKPKAVEATPQPE